MSARAARFAAALQALLLMATLILPALAAATEITTDLWVYQDGDTVTVTGVDFGANEVVDVVTTDAQGALVDAGTASTDGAGSFTYAFTLNVTIGGIYDVVATGQSSGLSATTQFDPPTSQSTSTSLTLGSSSITYGSSVSLSGSLGWTASGANNAEPSSDGRTITIRSYGNSTCTSGGTTVATATTSGGGPLGNSSYSTTYTPAAAGTRFLRAEFAGIQVNTGTNADNYVPSTSTCQQLVVSKANTSITGSISTGSIFVGQSFTVSYDLSAAVGVAGNTATGNVAVAKVGATPAGSLGCTPASIAVSQLQTSSGFGQAASGAFTCTPAGAGTWNLNLVFNATASGNYNDSNSSTMTVTVEAKHGTTLTEVLTPSTITYGESTVITGSLDDTTAGVPIVNVSVENDRQTGSDCGGSATLIGSDLTDINGDYSVNYRPTQTESKDIKASYAGDAGHLPAEACATLTVERAPTEIVDAVLSDSSISLLESSLIDYKVQSAFGVFGNNANGTLSMVKDSGAGTLTCFATTTAVNRPEADADGTGADDAGFGLVVNSTTNAAYRFVCSASANDTYTFHIHFSGDADFAASDSETLTLIVGSNTPPVITVPPSPITVEATGPTGAVVNFVVSATDAEDDPDPTPTCDWDSGDTFPIGTTTVHCSVSDSGGLQDSGEFDVVVEDTTAPVVVISALAVADGVTGWYNLDSSGTSGITIDVSVSDAVGATSLDCTDDTGSGPVAIAGPLSPAGDSFVIGDGEHTIYCEASDLAGNTGSDSKDFDVDQTAPSITITTPAANGQYILNDVVLADFDCSDAGSGIDSCVGTVADGDPIDTSAIGPYTFEVNAADVAGNTANSSVTYSVRYDVCYLYDKDKAHKAGSTIPIKIYLCDADGVDVSRSAVAVQAVYLTKIDNTPDGPLVDSGNANPENNFRYEATLGPTGGYIFNLSTKSASPALGQTTALKAGTYKLYFTVDSIGGYYVIFNVK